MGRDERERERERGREREREGEREREREMRERERKGDERQGRRVERREKRYKSGLRNLRPACTEHKNILVLSKLCTRFNFVYLVLTSRKDRRKKILLNTNRTFRPHGLPQQNREQSGEDRSYIPVPRQRDIGAPVPGTVNQVRGGGGGVAEVKGSD